MKEITLTKDNFNNEIINSNRVAVVDFWAPWCGPCRMMESVISDLANDSDGRYIVGKVNVDEEQELAVQYGIMSIPAIKIYKDGNVVSQTIGVTTKEKIVEMIQLLL